MKNVARFLSICLLASVVFGQQDDGSRERALVFTHATVIDATGAPAKSGMTVVVRDDRIEALGKTDEISLPEDAQVVDATGQFLIPGLWDMHVHPFFRDYLPLFIANGVTGIRVMSGEPMHHEWREDIRASRLIGPRIIITSQPVESPNDYSEPVVRNEDEARQFVRRVKNKGADSVKIGNSLQRGAYFAIADEAKKQGIRFVGHVPFSVGAAEASDAGQRSIEHAFFVLFASSSEEEARFKEKVLEFYTVNDEVEAWRARWALVANSVFNPRKATQLFAHLVRNNTWVCPTLMVIYDVLFSSQRDRASDPRLVYLPLAARDALENDVAQDWDSERRAAGATGKVRDLLNVASAKQLAIVREMNNAGVGLLAGTDDLRYAFGFDLHDELALYVQAGMSPLQALRTATYNPAEFLDELDSMGTIEQGKMADLVLLDGNPLQEISNTRKVAAVVVRGRLFDHAALQEIGKRVEVPPLHLAAAGGEIERVKELISNGADVNSRQIDGETPLHCAARHGHRAIVEVLLAHGANVSIGAGYGITAAEVALRTNHLEIAQLLASRGADISPLHFALYTKNEGEARRLIEGGADVNSRTPYGTTPLVRAVQAGFKEIVALLIAKGADVNTKDNWGWTALHAAVFGRKDIVELLIAHGADVGARDGSGRTPTGCARNEGRTEIVELLRKHEPKE